MTDYSRRSPVERLVTAAVALLAVAFILRLAFDVVRPVLPLLGGLVVAATVLVIVWSFVRCRDETW